MIRLAVATALLSGCAAFEPACPELLKSSAYLTVEACTLAYKQASTVEEIERLDRMCPAAADAQEAIEDGGAEQICEATQ